MSTLPLNRRAFIAGTSAALATAALPLPMASAAIRREGKPYEYCAFIKFLQELSYEEMAGTLKKLGFDGGEITVRKGGYIAPEAVADELPKLAEVFAQHDLNISLLTTDITSVETPNAEALLNAAAKLGVQKYRMGFLRYDLKQPILPQIEAFKPKILELAALNRETGMSAVYQNHAGAKYLGATFWDLLKLLDGIPVEEIGCVFDIRHAVVEAGTAWQIFYDIIKPHIGALSVKDFQWIAKAENDGPRIAEHGPLGKGQVDLRFFKMFKKDFSDALITLHIEYLKKDGVQANIDALESDFAVLRKAMGEKS